MGCWRGLFAAAQRRAQNDALALQRARGAIPHAHGARILRPPCRFHWV